MTARRPPCPWCPLLMRMPLSISEHRRDHTGLRGPRQRPTFCGNAIYTLCGCSAKLVLHHLAGGVQRQLVEELYIAGHLESRHSVAAPVDDVLRARCGATLDHHERL